jgi:hypothetical protein
MAILYETILGCRQIAEYQIETSAERMTFNKRIGLNASTEERAMMSSWRVTLLTLGFRRSNRPARDVDQAIIEG